MSFIVKTIGGWLGWRYIPDLLAGKLLQYFHQYYPAIFGCPPPAPGTPQYFKQRRYLYAVVVFSYAIYTFRQAATAIGPNFYESLGVTPTADEATLKAGFRSFARKYHPDRAGPQAETMFMDTRKGYEALMTPCVRFAYDRWGASYLRSVHTYAIYFLSFGRFGPSALTWPNCEKMELRDILFQGM